MGRQRQLRDGREIRHLHHPGQQVYLSKGNHPVWVSWVLHQSPEGQWKKHYWLSTRPLSASSINAWARRRWQIESFFRTAKQRFEVARFRVQSLNGLYRWLLLCWLAYLIAHWAALQQGCPVEPDWVAAAHWAALTLFFGLLDHWHRRTLEQMTLWRAENPCYELKLSPVLLSLSP